MVFIKEHAFLNHPPYPCPCGFEKNSLVLGGGVVNETENLIVSQASTRHHSSGLAG